MSSITKHFLLSLIVNFVVLACVSMCFEYFDTGDDPIYSKRVAAKNVVMAVVLAATIAFMNRKTAAGGA